MTLDVSLEIGEIAAMHAFNAPMYGKVSVSPFAPAQGNQLISANVFSSSAGQFFNANVLDGGRRLIRWQLRLRF